MTDLSLIQNEDPDKSVIVSVSNKTHYEYDLVANDEGEYEFETKNIGDTVFNIDGAKTKASSIGCWRPDDVTHNWYHSSGNWNESQIRMK